MHERKREERVTQTEIESGVKILILLACECVPGCLECVAANPGARTEGTTLTMLGKDYMLAIIIVNYDGE